jgi:hypothetical protein
LLHLCPLRNNEGRRHALAEQLHGSAHHKHAHGKRDHQFNQAETATAICGPSSHSFSLTDIPK